MNGSDSTDETPWDERTTFQPLTCRECGTAVRLAAALAPADHDYKEQSGLVLGCGCTVIDKAGLADEPSEDELPSKWRVDMEFELPVEDPEE